MPVEEAREEEGWGALRREMLRGVGVGVKEVWGFWRVERAM